VNEKALLERFWSYVSTNRVSGFVAHNGLGFDLPFLWKRSVINQVRPSTTFDLRRYRSDFVFDTMTLWAHWDPRAYPKLDALAGALGVGQKSGVGTEVAALWAAGKLKEIADYCLHDCWLAYGCYCRMEFAEFDAEQTIPTEIESY
jgi:predicted PolB exonuclease-like 3'-5' exonuclease